MEEEGAVLTVSQLKRQLRAAGVPEKDIQGCLERSQLDTLLVEFTDVTFKACVLVQRGWREVLAWRKARGQAEKLKVLEDQGANAGVAGPTAEQLAQANVFAKLSDKEVDFYREVFEKIDEDRSGFIDEGELKFAFELLGAKIEDEELAELVEAHGKKGEVDFTNFVKMVLGTQSKLQLGQKGQAIKLLSKQKLQKLQEAFREFDLDGSGAIDAEELLEVFKKLGKHSSLEDAVACIDEAMEGEGTEIDFEAFVDLMANPKHVVALAFDNRINCLQAEMGFSVLVLQRWRTLSSRLAPGLGHPRLADTKKLPRVRAGVVPIRKVIREKYYYEKMAGESSKDDMVVTKTVACEETQVLLVTSNTYPSLWVLPSGGQRLARPEEGYMDPTLVQTPQESATLHAAEEAGIKGMLGNTLGHINDPIKRTVTRWFTLTDVQTEDIYNQTFDFWAEKDMRRRKWFPLISEDIITTGEPPPRGKLGTKYSVIGEAAHLLLHRRPLHKALQAYVDGFACQDDALHLHLRRQWDGRPCTPSDRARAWVCRDAASGSLVLGVEGTFHDSPRPRLAEGPCQDLDSYESIAFYFASLQDAGRTEQTTDTIEYLQVVLGPHGHFMVQRLRGNRDVRLSCLPHDQLLLTPWYKDLLAREQESRRGNIQADFRHCVSMDKTRWTGTIVVPEEFVPKGKRFCANLYSIYGEAPNRTYLAANPVPSYYETHKETMHAGDADRIHPDMHAVLYFEAIAIPTLTHLCNWSKDKGSKVSDGPVSIAAHQATIKTNRGDVRLVDAGWDTMGQYWDNMARRADRLTLRTPTYPGIKSKNSSLPWKDNSRPPTRIGLAEQRPSTSTGLAEVDRKLAKEEQDMRDAIKKSNPIPMSDPWTHPGSASPFKLLSKSVNRGIYSEAPAAGGARRKKASPPLAQEASPPSKPTKPQSHL